MKNEGLDWADEFEGNGNYEDFKREEIKDVLSTIFEHEFSDGVMSISIFTKDKVYKDIHELEWTKEGIIVNNALIYYEDILRINNDIKGNIVYDINIKYVFYE